MANALRTGISRSARRASRCINVTQQVRSQQRAVRIMFPLGKSVGFEVVASNGAARRFIRNCWNRYCGEVNRKRLPRSKRIEHYFPAKRLAQVPSGYRALFTVQR